MEKEGRLLKPEEGLLLLLKLALEYNAAILSLATLYANKTPHMKLSAQKKLVNEIKRLQKNYGDKHNEVIDQMENTVREQ